MATALNVLISQDSWSQTIDTIMRSNGNNNGDHSGRWGEQLHQQRYSPAKKEATATYPSAPVALMRIAVPPALSKKPPLPSPPRSAGSTSSSGKPSSSSTAARQSRKTSSSSSTSSSAVPTYTKRDILSGRGGLANKHFGNKVFRRLIRHNKELYRKLKSKRKQDLLIKSILLAVDSQGGRFLKEDKKTGQWLEIEEREAWNKTSQALREPDKKTGEEGEGDVEIDSDTEDGRSSERSGSVPPVAIPMVPPPPLLARQYTAESHNPPHADRRIFERDDLMLLDDDDEAQVAPALLEMSTSTATFSRPLWPSQPSQRPSEISVPASGQHHRYHSKRATYHGELDDVPPPPPPFGRESTSLVLGLRSLEWTSLDAAKPTSLLRSDTIGTFVDGPDFGAATHSSPYPSSFPADAAAGASSQQSHHHQHHHTACPPPLPLLRFTSSAFLRGLDEVVVGPPLGGLRREESGASALSIGDDASTSYRGGRSTAV